MSDEYQSSPWRIGTIQLSSCPSKPNNIDISPSGTALIRSDEAVDIINVQHGGVAPFLKSDNYFVHHRDAGKRTETFHSSIFIGDVPAIGINGKVGKDEKVDLTTYENRFMHAQWAPLEIGPYGSPIFVTLTSRRDLHLWYAPDNQFTGPWQCLACLTDPQCKVADGIDNSVSSFTFLAPSSRDIKEETVYLMATSQDENRAIIWQIRPKEFIGDPFEIIVVYYSVPEGLDLKETYLLHSIFPGHLQIADEEKKQLIAVIGPKGLLILRFNVNDYKLEKQLWTNEQEEGSYSSIFANTYVYHAQWSERSLCLYLCTAGQVFEVNFHLTEKTQDLPSYARLILTIIDKDGEQIANLSPIIGLQFDQGSQHEMLITLKDGTMYRYKEGFPRKKQAITPIGEIEAPNQELEGLQRDVEKKRGMYAFQSDDCGVAFLNFDSNDLNAWSFIQHPTSTLEIAFTESQIADFIQSESAGPLSGAQEIMYEFINLEQDDEIPLQSIAKRSKLKRSLSLHTERAIDKAPIFKYCVTAIKDCKDDEPVRLASALQLSYWLKSFNGAGLERGEFVEVCKEIERLELRSTFKTLQDQIKFMKSLLRIPGREKFDTFSEMHCLRIAAIAFCLAKRMNEDLGTIESLLADLKGVNFAAKMIHYWTTRIGSNPETGIDIGERCPICDVPVLIGLGSPFEANCRDGHKWNRCSTTFGILCNVRASACIVCCHHSILLEDVTSDLQKTVLRQCIRCTLCGGTRVTI